VSAEAFTMGDQIIFNPGGDNEEELVVQEAVHVVQQRVLQLPAGTDGDYLIVTTPLQFNHEAGEVIVNLGPAGSPTMTPEPEDTATPTPTTSEPPPTATPTASPAGTQTTWGNANCSGPGGMDAADPVDSLLTLRSDAGLDANTGDCPPLGTEVDVLFASLHLWGDVDCSDAVNPVDSLKILRFDAGLSVAQEEGCPAIGAAVVLQG
jgi:hypothetical protein